MEFHEEMKNANIETQNMTTIKIKSLKKLEGFKTQATLKVHWLDILFIF